MSGALDGNRTITLSPDALLDIEEALNAPSFFGVPVGATLNEAMIVALYNAKRVWSQRAKVTDYLRYRYQRYRQPASGTRDFNQYKGRVIFTWLFDRSDLKALIFPLVERYGYKDALVVGGSASMCTQFDNRAQFVSWDELPGIDMKEWRREFDRCLPAWRQRLNQVLVRHSIPSFISRFLLCRLQVQTQLLMAASKFVDAVNPRAIVTEYDRGGISSCLVLVARQRGIPAVSLIHGAGLESYPSYGFAPILSTYACCWGEAHRHNLMEHGVDPEQLVITGCQSLSRTLEAQQDAARLKIGLPVDRPTVLLATNPIKLEDRKKYALAFCGAMSRLPEISAVVRLHPAENLAEYKKLIEGFPRVKFLPNDAMSRDESLAAADIVVNHESSFGIDALLKGKLVVVLDVLDAPLKVAKDLIELANCPMAKSSEELEMVIRKMLSNDQWKNELRAQAEQYALRYCDSYGQDAVDNVCRVIDQAIEQREPQTA
jgi:hypothetical protein